MGEGERKNVRVCMCMHGGIVCVFVTALYLLSV